MSADRTERLDERLELVKPEDGTDEAAGQQPEEAPKIPSAATVQGDIADGERDGKEPRQPRDPEPVSPPREESLDRQEPAEQPPATGPSQDLPEPSTQRPPEGNAGATTGEAEGDPDSRSLREKLEQQSQPRSLRDLLDQQAQQPRAFESPASDAVVASAENNRARPDSAPTVVVLDEEDVVARAVGGTAAQEIEVSETGAGEIASENTGDGDDEHASLALESRAASDKITPIATPLPTDEARPAGGTGSPSSDASIEVAADSQAGDPENTGGLKKIEFGLDSARSAATFELAAKITDDDCVEELEERSGGLRPDFSDVLGEPFGTGARDNIRAGYDQLGMLITLEGKPEIDAILSDESSSKAEKVIALREAQVLEGITVVDLGGGSVGGFARAAAALGAESWLADWEPPQDGLGELAGYIKVDLNSPDAAATIAEQIGKPVDFVTEHIVWQDPYGHDVWYNGPEATRSVGGQLLKDSGHYYGHPNDLYRKLPGDSSVDQFSESYMDGTEDPDYEELNNKLAERVQAGIAADQMLAELPKDRIDVNLEQIAAEGVVAQLEMLKINMKLVRHIAKRFGSLASDGTAYDHFNDIVGVGDAKLFLSIKTFDPTKGYQFSTYAGTAIENGIRQYLGRMREPLSYGSHAIKQRGELRRERAKYLLDNEQEPTDEKLAEIHNAWVEQEKDKHSDPDTWAATNKITPERIVSLRTTTQVSLSEFAVGGEHVTETIALERIMTQLSTPSAEDVGQGLLLRQEAREAIIRGFSEAGLTERERTIMLARLTDELALISTVKLAAILGINRETTRKLEISARQKLRDSTGNTLSRYLNLFDQED